MQKTIKERVYDFICENPGENGYRISKKLNVSTSTVRYALLQLKKLGLIKFKLEKNKSRVKKLTFPVGAFSLIPKGIKKQFKKIKVY